jgi:hypothetical protein
MNDKSASTKSTPIADPLLEEIWRIKDELSAARRHSVQRLFAEARRRQKESGRQIVDLSGADDKRTP